MIAITDILCQCIFNEPVELCGIIHTNKAKKERNKKPRDIRGILFIVYVFLFTLKRDFLYQLLITLLLHKDGGTKGTIAGYQGTNAIL